MKEGNWTCLDKVLPKVIPTGVKKGFTRYQKCGNSKKRRLVKAFFSNFNIYPPKPPSEDRVLSYPYPLGRSLSHSHKKVRFPLFAIDDYAIEIVAAVTRLSEAQA